MKISVAALSFLILAAALGSQASVIPESEIREHLKNLDQHRIPPVQHGFHNPSDCCFSYTSRRIRCTFIKDYFEARNGCPQPGVVFITKRGQRVCANPSDLGVQDCIRNLNLTFLPKDLEIRNLA